MGDPRARPRAFVVSCVFGGVGIVLLVLGLLSGSDTVMVTAAAAGALSLGAALVWRSQLVEAWHGERRRRPRPPLA